MSRIGTFKKQADVKDQISNLTKKNSKIGKEFLVKYKINGQEYQVFLINSFQTIGWADPFPHDDEFITGSMDDGINLVVPEVPTDLVYQRSRYSPDYSPLCIYVPKMEIMLKMMRACVEVKNPHDLWFHKSHNHDYEGHEH